MRHLDERPLVLALQAHLARLVSGSGSSGSASASGSGSGLPSDQGSGPGTGSGSGSGSLTLALTGSMTMMRPMLTSIIEHAGTQHCWSTVPRHCRQSQPGCGWNLAMNGGALPVRITCGVGGGGGEVVARAVARAAVAVRGEGRDGGGGAGEGGLGGGGEGGGGEGGRHNLVEQVVETLLVELGQVLRYALARAPGGRSADRLEGRARKTLGWRRGGVLRSRRC